MIIVLFLPHDNCTFSHALPHVYEKEMKKIVLFPLMIIVLFPTLSLIKHACASSNNKILYPKENLYKCFRGFTKNVLSILLNNNQQKSTIYFWLVYTPFRVKQLMQ